MDLFENRTAKIYKIDYLQTIKVNFLIAGLSNITYCKTMTFSGNEIYPEICLYCQDVDKKNKVNSRVTPNVFIFV